MEHKKREKIIVRTSIIGIIGNILLVGIKAFIGFLAGSISIIMDALNNLTDALSSLITIVGTKLSAKRPNKKHPYGYGRIEYITSTLIAGLILFAGVTALVESIKSIIEFFETKSLPQFEIYSLIVIGVAIVIKVLIGLFFRKRAKLVDSEALKSSGNDALFDSILSTSTLIGAIVAKLFGIYVEGFLGILIAVFILKSGFEALKESLSEIIGNRYDKEIIANIKNDICKVDGVLGAYDLILNSYGHNKNIGSIHVGVKDELTAVQIQDIERKIFAIMYEKYNTLITVGVYASNLEDLETNKMYKIVLDIIKEYKNVLQIHGFYVDKTDKNIYYDLVISFEEQKPEDLIEEIKAKNEKLAVDYKIHINYDQDFSLS